jgi:hypothetical protein
MTMHEELKFIEFMKLITPWAVFFLGTILGYVVHDLRMLRKEIKDDILRLAQETVSRREFDMLAETIKSYMVSNQASLTRIHERLDDILDKQ